jgi:hypothetical protein
VTANLLRANSDYESSLIYIDDDRLDPGQDIESHMLGCSSGEYWAYPIHDFCWELLLNRLSLYGKSSDVIQDAAIVLFNVMNCTPCTGLGILIPEHQYHGSVTLRRSAEGRHLLLSDPTMLPPEGDLNEDISSHISKIGYDRLSNTASTDIISRLPTEIIFVILNNLSSKDICNLRLSSRPVASISAEPQFPQSFWASRFAWNREMGFVYAHDPLSSQKPSTSWRHMYHACNTARKAEKGFAALQNRRRCWRSVEEFAVTMDPLLAHMHTKLYGEGGSNFMPMQNRIHLGQQVACDKLGHQRFLLKRHVGGYNITTRTIGTRGTNYCCFLY